MKTTDSLGLAFILATGCTPVTVETTKNPSASDTASSYGHTAVDTGLDTGSMDTGSMDTGSMDTGSMDTDTGSQTDSGMDSGMDSDTDSADDFPFLRTPVPGWNNLPNTAEDQPLSERFPFLRGDVDGDGQLTLSDAVSLLQYLFGGQPLSSNQPCLDAADVNDDGRLDISDGITLLEHLFDGGTPPAAPFPESGYDPGVDGDHLTEACSLPVTDSLVSTSASCECDWDLSLHTTYQRKNVINYQDEYRSHSTGGHHWGGFTPYRYHGIVFDRYHLMNSWGNTATQVGKLLQSSFSGLSERPTSANPPEIDPMTIENYTQAITELQLQNTGGCTEDTCIWPAGESRVDATMAFTAGGENSWALFGQDEFSTTAASEILWRGGVSLQGDGSQAVSVSSDPTEGLTFTIPAFSQSIPIRVLPPEQFDRKVLYPYRDFSTLNDTGTRYGLKLDVKTALDMVLDAPWSGPGVAHTSGSAETKILADVSGGCEGCGVKAYLRDRIATVEITRCGEVELQCYQAVPASLDWNTGFDLEPDLGPGDEPSMNEVQTHTMPWKQVPCKNNELPDSLAPQSSSTGKAQLSPAMETAQEELAQILGVSPALRSESVVVLEPEVGDLLAGLGNNPSPCFQGTLTEWALLPISTQETAWETCTDLETHAFGVGSGDVKILLPLGVQVAR